MMGLSIWDCEELAAHLVGVDYDECEDSDEIWARIYDKYEIGDDDFVKLIGDLMPMIQVASSMLIEGGRSKGFGKTFGDNGKFTEMFVKMDV